MGTSSCPDLGDEASGLEPESLWQIGGRSMLSRLRQSPSYSDLARVAGVEQENSLMAQRLSISQALSLYPDWARLNLVHPDQQGASQLST